VFSHPGLNPNPVKAEDAADPKPFLFLSVMSCLLGIFSRVIKRLGNSTTCRNNESFNGNLFMLSEWNVGVMEYWDQGGNKTILIVKNSFKPIIPSFHYSNWGEAPKFFSARDLCL
jgi:hypothetical protein